MSGCQGDIGIGKKGVYHSQREASINLQFEITVKFRQRFVGLTPDCTCLTPLTMADMPSLLVLFPPLRFRTFSELELAFYSIFHFCFAETFGILFFVAPAPKIEFFV